MLRRCRCLVHGLAAQPFRHSLTSTCGLGFATESGRIGVLGFGMPVKQMRTETGGRTSGPVLGFEFYPIRLLIELSILEILAESSRSSTCVFEGLQSPPHPPRSLPYTEACQPLPLISVCGLRSGFASRPDPFQLYGCRARSSGGCSSPRNCLVLRKYSLFSVAAVRRLSRTPLVFESLVGQVCEACEQPTTMRPQGLLLPCFRCS